jgi:23S rRNA A2030 N6-methylase RlmJ
MPYDHNEKAGNQGDVIKHIALLAAVDTILQSHDKKKPFLYCDTFAGYACSQLIKNNGWKDGIGKLFNTTNSHQQMIIRDDLSENNHVKQFRDLYLSGRPSYVGRMYPGSSLIVHDLCVRHGIVPKFSLWDISPAAIASLMMTYSGMGHAINPRPAKPNAKSIERASFVFVDPPKAPMTGIKGSRWNDMIQFLKPQHQNFMFWLPIDFKKSKGEMIENTKEQREEALNKNLDVLQVRWKKDGNTIKTVGCQLFYRFEEPAKANIEAAVRNICTVLDWDAEVMKAEA